MLHLPGLLCCSQSLYPCGRPLLTHASTGDTPTLKGRSDSESCGVTASFPGSGCAQCLFVPSECLWQVHGLIFKSTVNNAAVKIVVHACFRILSFSRYMPGERLLDHMAVLLSVF